MMAALKDYVCENLEEEPWSDVEATLWYVVQRVILFKEKRMMVKLKTFVMTRRAESLSSSLVKGIFIGQNSRFSLQVRPLPRAYL